MDFRQARISGKETVSAQTLPERKVQLLQDITRFMKAVQKARKSLQILHRQQKNVFQTKYSHSFPNLRRALLAYSLTFVPWFNSEVSP